MLVSSASSKPPSSSGGNNGGANGSNGVNPKLLHLVQKVVSQQQSSPNNINSITKPSVEYVMHCVRTQNVEYQRKNQGHFKKQVSAALAFVYQQQQQHSKEAVKLSRHNSNASIASSQGGDSHKCGRNRSKTKKEESFVKEEEGEEEVSSEEEFDRIHDALRSQNLGGSALNASLRLRYEKLQREKDAEALAAAAKDAEGEAASNSNNINHNKNASTTPTKDSKSRKRKLSDRRKSKTSSKRLSGSSGPDFMDENGDDAAAILKPVPRPRERYSDLGGMNTILQQIRELIEYPLVRPELYVHLGVGPPRGILLRGPPGTGKSHLANAIAGQLGVPYFRVSAPELVSGMSGESEGRIRGLFKTAADMAPAIIFLDELDAIAPKRSDTGGGRGMEKRMVAQLLTSMDLLDPQYTRQQAPVIVLGATNRPDSLDSALRRAGRFDKEILLGVPDEAARQNILKKMTQGMRLSGDFDFKVLARKTPGFVGADVRSLTKEAAVIAINRIFRDVLLGNDIKPQPEESADAAMKEDDHADNSEGGSNDVIETGQHCKTNLQTIVGAVQPLTPEQLEPLFVTMEDFLQAIPFVQPSGKREGFAVVPDVTWDDIGAMHEIREELTMSVLEPIRNPEKFKVLGLSLPAGVLLYGPPGCGKTLLAKAVANESGANFISVKGPELLDKYVGESERAVRLVFERARSSSPCIVFFDELDSLCPKRGSEGGGGSGVSERVVNQLLTEMDGLESRRSVFVIAATNRPELIDPAMMRPGRLDKLLYVPLPSAEDRVAILSALSTNVKFGTDVNLSSIGRSQRADGFSGADCAALLREAGLSVLKEDIANADVRKSDADLCIEMRHFDSAFHHVMPSVSKKDQARYDRIRNRMARARSRGAVSDGGAQDATASCTFEADENRDTKEASKDTTSLH